MEKTLKHRFSTKARYFATGIILGLFFMISGTIIESQLNYGSLSIATLITAQKSNPLLWIIDTAPVCLGLLTFLIGIKQSRIEKYMCSLKQMVQDQTVDLSKVKNRLENIIDSIGEILIIMDNDGTIMDINVATLRAFEYEKKELIGQPGSILLGQSGLDSIIIKNKKDIFESGFLRTLDEEYQTHSGRKIYLSISTSYLWDANGQQEGIVCVAKDITEIKQMEAQLIRSKEDYENLFNSAPNPIIVAQKDQIVFFNSRLEKYLGYAPEEIQGRSVADFIPEEDRDLILRSQRRLEKGKRIEGSHTIRYKTKSGVVRWAEISTTPFIWDNQPSALSFLIDTTEQHEFEIALRTSEEQYRSLVQSLNVIIMKADQDFRITFLNQYGQDFFGYSEAEVLGKNIIGTLTPPKETTGRDLEKMIERIITNPEQHADNENENICKDGGRKWVVWKNTPVYSASGGIEEILSSGYDITERRKAADQIRMQQQKLEEAHKQMNIELDQAKLAQLSLLPNQVPTFPNLELAVKYNPMAQIGGDFYDLLINPDGSLGLLVGDVTGHGIPAALLSFMYLTTFKNSRKNGATPDQIIHNSNHFLSGKLPEGKYATVCYCTFDPESLRLDYSSAGHPPGFLIRPGNDKPQLLQTPGMVVGMFKEPVLPFQSQSVQLQKGDKVIIYTDGMMEVTDSNDRLLDTDALEQYVVSRAASPISDLLEEVYRYCDEYAGKRGFNDDVTMIGFEVL